MRLPGRTVGAGLRLVLCLTLAAAPSLASAGCSGGAPTVITGPVTITFWHSQRGAGSELLGQLAAEFSSVEPNITVKVVSKDDPNALAEELDDAVAAGEAPALAEVPEAALPGLRARQALQTLQSFIASQHYGLEVADRDDFWPAFIQSNTAGRQVWGLPFSHKVYALVYNPSLVAVPPDTWDALKETASALTRRDPDPAKSVFGLAFRANAELFALFLYQNGGSLVSGDPPKAAFNSQAGMTALDYLYELAYLRKAVLLTMGSPIDALVDGRAAMAIVPVGWAPGGAGPSPLAIAPLPAGLTRATLAPGTSLVLTAGRTPAEQEAAWRFVRWLTEPENAARWAAATGDVPIRRSVVEQPVWRYGFGRDQGWRDVLAQMGQAVALPYGPGWAQVAAELSGAVRVYLLGQANSSQAVLDGAAQEANQALSSR